MAKSTTTYWNPLASESQGRWTPVTGLEGMVEELTLSIDLAPTLLELLGVAPPRDMHGRSLVPYLSQPRRDDDEVVFSELVKRRKGKRLVMAREGMRKWIWHEPAVVPTEIYDLAADPKEKQKLAAPGLLEEGDALLRRYHALGRGATLRPPPAAHRTLDPETEQKLKALGYAD